MYDPARAKYEYVSLTEAFMRITMNSKQEDGEDLLDYARWFKQAKDIMKASVGKDILDKFMERMKESVKADTANKPTCPHCGTPILGAALAGLCPACLLQ